MSLRFILNTSLVLLSFVTVTLAGTIDDLLLKAEHARKSFKDLAAINYYKEALQLDSNNFQALWNISFLYQRMGWLEEKNLELRKQLLQTAIRYAQDLISKYPDTYEANIVMAGGIARMSEFYSSKEKVSAVWEIKKYGDKALSLNSNDHQAWYLMGWLNFEISKASWMERSLAGLLFGGLPKGMTLEKGIEYLEKANHLNPNSIVYLYDLATFYERTNTATAIQVTKRALTIPPVAPEDFIYLEKCRSLLTRL